VLRLGSANSSPPLFRVCLSLPLELSKIDNEGDVGWLSEQKRRSGRGVSML
jgi:hypothetical protein